MNATKEKLIQLKNGDQDHEWYPTTDTMVTAIFNQCGVFRSILDIGAGDGRVLEQIQKLCIKKDKEDTHNHSFYGNISKYAIEKSMIHNENMPADISIVGTDFMVQTLIDKKVDIVFCNPPYSEYEAWATKIIKEANAKKIFLILPIRWTNSNLIKQAIKQRGAIESVIWSGDFVGADRQARAKVEIIKINITDADRDYERETTDPFHVWFDEYFSDFDKLKPVEEDAENQEERPGLCDDLVKGQNLVEYLSELYAKELKDLLENYQSLSKLDITLLKELGVSVEEIKKAL
ncbi:hypothetical protein LCGC14_0608460, partial [marine sediment metagenome]